MQHEIHCRPLGLTYTCGEDETLLAAALRQGHIVPHSCSSGRCGTCKVRILEGDVERATPKDCALTPAEEAEGLALLCQSRAHSPVTLELNMIDETADIPVRRIMSRVHELERVASDVMRITLKLAEGDAVKFAAGQHVNVVLGASVRRCVSIANSPGQDGFVELHLKNYGGVLSTHVFEKLKAGDLIRMEGPLGIFAIRRSTERPIVFVASGTGFAPIKAMVEQLIHEGSRRPVAFYWAGRRPADLYMDELARSWEARAGLRYVPVLAQPLPEDQWQGKTGFVQDVIAQDFPDLSGHELYICGAPILIDSARKVLQERCGLRDFYTDEFKKS
ncbi:CDP-6-deoxy-delta-3,4-glucoseen reductase [Bordetella tumbae]|uniref:2Fe-2S iron-sulfur cluster-binding protein n=1 Tax=Bordetella tumbae TaxID=1649139 RepID=UPI0039EF6639